MDRSSFCQTQESEADSEDYPLFRYIGGVPTFGCIGSEPNLGCPSATFELVLPSVNTDKSVGKSPSQHWMLNLLLSPKHETHEVRPRVAAGSLLAGRSRHWLLKGKEPF